MEKLQGNKPKKPVLRVENLTKSYGDSFTLEIPELLFQSGKIYALVGPNGAGKTTLLNLLNLLERPDRGRIYFAGEEITPSSSKALYARRKMSMVMENPFLFHTTVFGNIAYGLKTHLIDKRSWQEKVEEALRMVGLEGFEKRKAWKLSRGETQRVAIARALVLKPEVLFLDEPFTNIDKGYLKEIKKLIKKINKEYGTTIILTTHNLSLAYQLSDKVISFFGGKTIKNSLENLFSVILEDREEVNGSKSKWAWISPNLKVAANTKKIGKAHLSISPQDIIISKSKLPSERRSSFRGTVKKIRNEGSQIKVSVDIGVEVVALIDKESFIDLGINIDSLVSLTFKPNSVTVL